MSLDPSVPDVGLSVTVQLDGDAVRLLAVGEIVFSTADVLRESLSRALEKSPPAAVLDMAGVTFLDSTGMSVLVHARNHAVSQGTAFTLINCRLIVRRVLEITGLGVLTGGQ